MIFIFLGLTVLFRSVFTLTVTSRMTQSFFVSILIVVFTFFVPAAFTISESASPEIFTLPKPLSRISAVAEVIFPLAFFDTLTTIFIPVFSFLISVLICTEPSSARISVVVTTVPSSLVSVLVLVVVLSLLSSCGGAVSDPLSVEPPDELLPELLPLSELLPELFPLSELLPELLPPEMPPSELLPPDDSFVNAIPTTSLMI